MDWVSETLHLPIRGEGSHNVAVPALNRSYPKPGVWCAWSRICPHSSAFDSWRGALRREDWHLGRG